jgi:5-methylcytosine-specific restriction endonuclease McrA
MAYANYADALEYGRKRSAQQRKKHPELHRAQQRKHYNKHKVDVRARQAEWQRNNPENRAAANARRFTRKTQAGGSYTVAEWETLCRKYHNKCVCCGKKKKLTPDHVVPVSKGGSSNIENIQPLCGPCNSSKKDKTIDFRRTRCQEKKTKKRRYDQRT